MRCAGLFVLLAACQPAAIAPRPAAPPATTPCTGRSDLVVVPRGPIAARWQGSLTIGGSGLVDVWWCGTGDLVVHRYVVGQPPHGTSTYELLDRIASGRSAAYRVPGRVPPSRDPIVVFATAAEGREVRAESEIVSVDDPARVAALEACRACGGTWARRGLIGRESCDCPTRDAGKRCTAATDCQGHCLHSRWEAVTEGPPCEAGQIRERRVGTCSPTHMLFGCNPEIIEADASSCVQPGLARRRSVVCRD